MTERKFENLERVIVSQTPVDASDKRYSGKVGNVVSLSHKNGDRAVYLVMLDEADFEVAFYDQDLLPYNELEVLRVELAEAENRVVELREAIKLKERNASDLPIATVVYYKDTYGPASITKQAEGVWMNVFPSQSGNPITESLTNATVTELLTNRDDATIRKP